MPPPSPAQALVNITYANAEVQGLIRTLGGLPLVQAQLTSSAYKVFAAHSHF